MKNMICDAIRGKNLLEFYYNGYHRVVEPFTFGVSQKNNEVLAAYQVRGGSESGKSNPWRLFDLDEIKNIQILNESFIGNREGYRREDPRMSRIYCEV